MKFFSQTQKDYYKFFLILSLSFYLVISDLTQSTSIIHLRLLNLFFIFLFLITLRKHFNSICIRLVLRINFSLRQLSIAFIFIFFMLQMLRPLFISFSESRAFSAIYWPIQLFLIATVSLLLIHDNRCLQFTNCPQTFSWNSNRGFEVLLRSLFTYLILVSVLSAFELQIKIGSLTFSDRTTNLLPTFVLFPVITIAIAYGRVKDVLMGNFSLLMMLYIAIQLNSRTLTVSLIVLTFFCFYFLLRSKAYNLIHFQRILPFALSVFFLIIVKFSVLLQLVQDILNFGRPRHLDTGVLETVDLDRILQLKVAWEALKVDPVHLIFGYGYLESSFVLANPLFLLYQKYLPHLDFVKELGSRENVSVYGFSAILVDFGILGIACLVFLFSSQAISLPWKTDPEYSKLWMGCLSIVLVQLFTTNHLGSFFFIVLLTSSITLLCAHYSMNMRLRYI